MFVGITVRYKEFGNPLFMRKYIIPSSFVEIANYYGITLIPICSDIDLEKVSDLCRGLIITGSSIDIDKSYYDSSIRRNNSVFDEYKLDRKIISSFRNKNKPILGICGGLQEINVFFGGTLKRVENHRNVEHKIYFTDKCENVNSFHSYCIDKLGNELNLIATAKDGTIEAIESNNKLIIGYQFHPEICFDFKDFDGYSSYSNIIFTEFFNKCINSI